MPTGKKAIVWYGPQPCPTCQKMVVTSSQDSGAMVRESFPEGPIYPNSKWIKHDCKNTKAEQPTPAN